MTLKDLIHAFEVLSASRKLFGTKVNVVDVKGAKMATTATAADSCREVAETQTP